ncbi:MAG: diaminopimelate epimerase [Verrucomicrobiota bacterium]
MQFFKYHALGNDYLVLDPKDAPQCPSAGETVKICHRNFGLGSDGILYGPEASSEADFGLRILNPDGSEAEKSGNGLRIFARYLFDVGRVTEAPFTVMTLGGKVTCQVLAGGEEIEVEMGKVSFRSEDIPVVGEAREVLDEPLEIAGKTWATYAATIGNPHVVVPMPAVSKALAYELGPVLENMTERFPNRTNVQLLQVLDRNNIQIEIWERGAGYTLASGSSSSAAAVVAHKMGACDQDITVHCPGGDIGIKIGPDYAITMVGPATRVGRYEMDSAVVEQSLPNA